VTGPTPVITTRFLLFFNPLSPLYCFDILIDCPSICQAMALKKVDMLLI
jgi:hypothetical protein